MRRALVWLSVGIVGVSPVARASQAPPAAQSSTPLAWAYPVNPPASPPGTASPASADAKRQLDGSAATFTQAELRDLFNVADWHPDNHPPMPDVVVHGRRPDVRACGYCHLPNGQGRPENSSLAGLPAAYIAQQMADFRNGLRESAEPRMGPPALMLTIGKATTPDESTIAADYFASFAYKPWIRVVETAEVPKTRVQGSMYVPIEGGGAEPIGQRIVETPEHLGRTELRDSASGFVAYVPPGSVARGRALVSTGGSGRTVACGTCHGADLKGLGPVPPLAGRSPSYLARQLWDLKTGHRRGPWAALMAAAVKDLTPADIVDIGAYTASLAP